MDKEGGAEIHCRERPTLRRRGCERAKSEKRRNVVNKPKVDGNKKPIPRPKKVVQNRDEEDGEEVQD